MTQRATEHLSAGQRNEIRRALRRYAADTPQWLAEAQRLQERYGVSWTVIERVGRS